MNNILYLPTRYFPAISGAEFYLQRLAEIFKSKYNYKIDIFTSNAIDFKALRNINGKIIDKNQKYYSKVNKLKVNRFSANYDISIEEKINFIKNLDEFKSIKLSEACLKKCLENGPYLGELINLFLKTENLNYDLIHITFFPYFNLITGLIVGSRLNKPTICTPFYHFSNPRYLDKDLIELLQKFDILIACTTIEKKILIDTCKISKEKIKVVPMGVDFRFYENSHKMKINDYYFKENFFKKGEKNYKMILFCGYKNYEKGSISILKAIPYILNKIKKVYFVFIGPSTLAFNRELSKLRKKMVVRIINLTPDNLTGYYDKKKISAFKEADIFLMPSRSDAFGIAFLEAWAAGKPVIGANIGATPEVIRNNIDGFLVKFDDPLDITEKVIKLLRNKRLRNKFGSAGKSKVIENYAWEIVANKTHIIYQDLIHK